jgi:dTDP-4-amino-4,6-dideoxygalactose transaminase
MIQLFKPYVSEEAIQNVASTLRSGWIGSGQRTAEFEEQFARYVGARYAVAVNSATAALHLAMVISGVQPGDEVLTPSLTFVSTNEVILYQQATPVFVDVDERTLLIDLEKAEQLISPRVRALMVVDYAGNPPDLTAVYAFARRHKLAVIEDAAHACGATFKGQRIGSFGLTCFSFHAVKNLPVGDGGMVTLNDKNLYDKLIRLRWCGIDRDTFVRSASGYQWEYNVTELGYKYQMNDISASIGLAQLKYVDEWNERRREIVSIYRNELAELESHGLRFVEHTTGASSANHLCVIRVPRRNAIVEALNREDIFVGVHYKPSHHYTLFNAARRSDLAKTEQAYDEIISLPLHLFLTDENVYSVCQALRTALTSAR